MALPFFWHGILSAERPTLLRDFCFALRMAAQCYRKPGSEPPSCGIHNSPLELALTSDVGCESYCQVLLCPEIGQTIRDVAQKSWVPFSGVMSLKRPTLQLDF
ncbi:MAG TPA: hypothetical protein VE195_05465 [Acidobacteriaceae bacterium]|nr:hypothetical protein [Acidobacteriaceae bacterium]